MTLHSVIVQLLLGEDVPTGLHRQYSSHETRWRGSAPRKRRKPWCWLCVGRALIVVEESSMSMKAVRRTGGSARRAEVLDEAETSWWAWGKKVAILRNVP